MPPMDDTGWGNHLLTSSMAARRSRSLGAMTEFGSEADMDLKVNDRRHGECFPMRAAS